MKNALGVSIGDDATKVGSRIIADPGAQNDSLSILLLKEFEHGLKWEGAAHVGIEHEEPIRPAFQDGISEVIEATSSAKSLVLPQILDLDLRELPRGVLDEVTKDIFFIVSDEDHFLDIWNFGHGFQAVPDDGVAGNIKQRLEGEFD